jgi:hypothetical protein
MELILNNSLQDTTPAITSLPFMNHLQEMVPLQDTVRAEISPRDTTQVIPSINLLVKILPQDMVTVERNHQEEILPQGTTRATRKISLQGTKKAAQIHFLEELIVIQRINHQEGARI